MQNYVNKSTGHVKPRARRCSRLPVLLLLLLPLACSRGPEAPDVSHIPVNVHIERFDQALFAIDTNNIAADLQQLHASYPVFLPTYLEQVMNFGPYADTSRLVQQQMHMMLTNRDFRQLQDSVNAKFGSLAGLEKELAQGLRYMKYYFPAFREPKRILTFISAIGNYGAVTVDSVLGIGLDMYMGSDFSIYKMLPDYPAYMVRRFTPAYITVNCMQVLAQDMFHNGGPGDKLVVQMVNAGRQQYLLQQVLPETPDTIRLGYTKEQLDWCLDNEQFIWQYFVQGNLLYKSDWQDNMHYMNDAPSTQGMPPGAPSPGKIGHFVGWRIVQQYMKRHPETGLQQLMEMKDAMQLFNGARYRPK